MRFNRTRYPLRTIVRWLWHHHKGFRVQAMVNMVIGLLLVGLGLLGVELVRRLTDIATGTREGDLAITAILLGSVILSEMLLRIILTWVRAVIGVKAQNRFQQYFFARILRGEWRGVEHMHSGDLLNRLFADVGDIMSLLTEVLPSLVIIMVQFIASFVYLYAMDSMLAVILIAAAPVFIFLSRLYFNKMRRIVRKIKDSNSALQSLIQESIQHKMVVKVMERGDSMVDRLEKRQKLLRWQVKQRARFSIMSKVMVNVGFAGGYLAALVWGLFQLQGGGITMGILMAFTQLIGRIQRPLLDMARLLPTLVSSLTSCERLMELERFPLEPRLQPVKVEGSVGVRLENVTYRYKKNGKPILKNFSHDFRPGSFTAILGETGAGKTTIIRMLLALIRPQEGQVSLYSDSTVEPVPVTNATRCNFSYVPQGNTLFSGTIRENLLMGNPNATSKEMHEALRLARAEFVETLPEGIDTMCGESGGGLSEGQAQRVCIARALLRPCQILLLDEATSALDMQTEREVLQTLKTYRPELTIIFITHRLAVCDYTTDTLTMEHNDEEFEEKDTTPIPKDLQIKQSFESESLIGSNGFGENS